MEYAVDASKNQTLGIRGWILIICTIEIFIAKYFTPFKIGIKGISEINFIIFIFLVMAGIRISLNREKISFQSFDYPLIILLVYSFFSILFSCFFYNYSYIEELILFKNYLNPFIIYFLFKNVIRTTKEAKTLIYILVIVLAIICFHALLSYFFGESEYIHYRGRAQGIIKEPNVLAMFILFHSPFLFLLPTNENKMKIIFKIIAIIILNLAIIQTGSRGAFLGLCALYMLILANKKYRTKMILTGIIVSIIVFLTVSFSIFGDSDVFTRFKDDRVQRSIDGSFDLNYYSGQRMTLWGNAIQGFLEKPIFGQGFDSFSRRMEKSFGRKTSAHNEYLEVLFKLGAIGFIFFATFYFMIWKYLKVNSNLIIAKAGHYALITYFITMFFVNTSTAIYPIFMTLAIVVRYTELEMDNL